MLRQLTSKLRHHELSENTTFTAGKVMEVEARARKDLLAAQKQERDEQPQKKLEILQNEFEEMCAACHPRGSTEGLGASAPHHRVLTPSPNASPVYRKREMDNKLTQVLTATKWASAGIQQKLENSLKDFEQRQAAADKPRAKPASGVHPTALEPSSPAPPLVAPPTQPAPRPNGSNCPRVAPAPEHSSPTPDAPSSASSAIVAAAPTYRAPPTRRLVNGDWTLQPYLAGGCPKHSTWYQNPQFLLAPSGNGGTFRVVLSLQDRTKRQTDPPQARSSAIGLLVLRGQEGRALEPTYRRDLLVHKTKFKLDMHVEVDSLRLEPLAPPQCYVVLPCTFDPGQQGSFHLEVSSDDDPSFRFEETGTRS